MKIKIIGTGISGLLTAYYLKKLLPANRQDIQIECFDKNAPHEANASTNSLAWLNLAFSCKDIYTSPYFSEEEKKSLNENAKLAYDRFRHASIKEWLALNEALKQDGIDQVLSTNQQTVYVDNHSVNSIYVFFNEEQVEKFNNAYQRIQTNTDHFNYTQSPQDQIVEQFPFLENLSQIFSVSNVSDELLVNPKLLRKQLIQYLQKEGVQFYWNTPLTADNLEQDPNSQWILAGGNGNITLVENTSLNQKIFYEKNMADVIHCTLQQPIDLKGKVFHFEASQTTPHFHLRNDEEDPSRLKIIVARQGGKTFNLQETAQAIFKLLQVNVLHCDCNDQVERPLTPDNRPLVSMALGENKNIHVVYGHSLYTCGASLFKEFSNNIAYIANQKSAEQIFNVQHYSQALDQFSENKRFAETEPALRSIPLAKIPAKHSALFSKSMNDSENSIAPQCNARKLFVAKL